jgi:Sugar kinases, ribokinase family
MNDRVSRAPASRMVVFGSLNLDLVWRVSRLPSPGETISCLSAARAFGGKGANVAVAATRAGGRVTLVGALGDDEPGRAYRAHLAAEGVDARLENAGDLPTGSAHVYVDDAGENLIVVHGGANDWWNAERVRAALLVHLDGAALLLLPAEIPVDAATAALREAARAGVPALFNASPCPRDFDWGGTPIDTVVVNEHECREIFGHAPEALAALDVDGRRGLLRSRGVSRIVATRGARPTLWLDDAGCGEVPAHPVRPVDTVGAGDTFAGVLAVGLAEGDPFAKAIRRANVAAALSALESGAQTAMPRRNRIEMALLSPTPL